MRILIGTSLISRLPILVVFMITAFASQAIAESIGDARDAVRKEYVKPAEKAAAEAKTKAAEAKTAENKAKTEAKKAETAKKDHESAQQQTEKLKTAEGKAEVKGEAEKKASSSKESAKKADEAAKDAKAEAEKAGEEVKRAEEAAKTAMAGGNVSEMEKKINELENARKKAKEADEAAKKAAEAARKAAEAAEKAEKAVEESLDEDKAKEKEKSAKEAAMKAEKEAESARKAADKAREDAREARKKAEAAKKAAEEAVKRFKNKFGKKSDKIDGELERVVTDIDNLAYVQVPSFKTTSVTFVALGEKTMVNEGYFGKRLQYTFYAKDDKVVAPEKAASIIQKSGTQLLNIFNSDVAKVVIAGTLASAVLESRGGSPGAVAAEPGEILPTGGDVRINPDGSIKESISVGENVEIEKLLDYKMFVAQQPVTIVAARENEIAIDGYGFAPAETISESGTVNIRLQTPDGTALSKDVPCWMANLVMEPVTHVGKPAPIKLVIDGVPGNQIVDIIFIPGPGQSITPLNVSSTVDELKGSIAVITTEATGPQKLDAVISRGALIDRPLMDASSMNRDELQAVVKDLQLAEGARMLQKIQGETVPTTTIYEKTRLKEYRDELKRRPINDANEEVR